MKRWWVLGPVAAVAVAVGAGLVTSRQDDGTGPPPPAPPEEELVEVSSDAPVLATLPELVAAADVVVRGEVEATERGRPFGDPGQATITSRLVTLHVDEVLTGEAPPTGTVLVEEEGWLDDGRALVIDGARPSRVGDSGVWFLVAVDDPDLPVYLVPSAQGRYLVDDAAATELTGADGDDPLIDRLTSLGLPALIAEIRGS